MLGTGATVLQFLLSTKIIIIILTDVNVCTPSSGRKIEGQFQLELHTFMNKESVANKKQFTVN